MYTFNDLYYHNTLGADHGQFHKILALDPGETTGVAFLYVPSTQETAEPTLSCLIQLPTKKLDWQSYMHLDNLILKVQSDILVVEDYRIFSWKRDQHVWSELHTPKLIGMIIALAFQHKIPITFQTPQQAKGFCTDIRLKAWGFYSPSHRHSNDAVRHAIYYALFGGRNKIVAFGESHV